MTKESQVRAQGSRSPGAVYASVLGFTREDVAANREGRLSSSQRKRLLGQNRENTKLAWIGLGVCAVLAFLGSGAAALQGGRSLLAMWTGVSIGMAVIAAVVWLGVVISRWKLRRALADGVVRSVDGSMYLSNERGKHALHYVTVGRASFFLEIREHRRLTEAGVDGFRARVYYIPRLRKMISVEALQ